MVRAISFGLLDVFGEGSGGRHIKFWLGGVVWVVKLGHATCEV